MPNLNKFFFIVPTIHEVYKRCIVRAEDEKHDDSEKDFIHPSRLISFLVGIRGKNETMAIGGPWSKKLDGENPEDDPNVLIRTAIRTCKGLTGIDLSNCTQWYRFVELKYRRSEQNKKDASESSARSARIETVVIFLPDVSSCMPNRSEWEGVQQQYKMALDKFLTADTTSHDKEESADVVIKIADDNKSNADTEVKNDQVEDIVMADSSNVAATTDVLDGSQNDTPIDLDTDESKHNEDGNDASSELDPKNMKVTELRAELSARNLSTKGLKNELVERLEQALKNTESTSTQAEVSESMQQDENGPTTSVDKSDENSQKDQEMDMNISEMDISEVTVIDEYDSTKCDEQEEKTSSNKKKIEPKKMDEKEKHMWEKKYQLPENPHVIVHPSKTAKNGKFDCTVVSLSLLLDYRKDDTKEHSFEIALFAEAFNEMLMRDFGYNIYKAFNYFSVNNKPKDDDKKKETLTEVETALSIIYDKYKQLSKRVR
ncbi:hypothetical protein PVAND_002013 [Polypedilum vanderplanki]|uniref:SAP domain-containing protein n=1 Tax=Polypedilum vanderplanki TaxID=319348 RepID=A0A9J6BQ22_POLVA|nr:hypothetical protein PVAND_002013 [Polypedilum vanderplanki]